MDYLCWLSHELIDQRATFYSKLTEPIIRGQAALRHVDTQCSRWRYAPKVGSQSTKKQKNR